MSNKCPKKILSGLKIAIAAVIIIGLLKAVIPLVLLGIASYMAYCFVRRQSR